MAQSAVAAASDHELILGRFRALRPLGSGGSGSVWLAVDQRNGHEVALKVVPREGKAGVRAEREAEAVARLRHPHCARVFSVDRDAGHVYVAYEYVPGITVREAIRGGRLDDRGAIEVAAQVLDALAHAHAKGIIHRDVKPANVLLAETGKTDARLLDFGLALMADAETLTATGDVPGTLGYISPERLRGEEATGAADVWAVGVMLWEALAGQQPFFASSPVETANLIMSGAPPLASARPDLPRPVLEAVEGALALDPAERPPAKRLAHELRDSLAAQARRRVEAPAGSRRHLLARAEPAALAATFAATTTSLLPFFPQGGPAVLGALAGAAALVNARAGLAFALLTPILPLGNVSFALASLYSLVALVWLLAFWGDSSHGLLVVAGPVLALVPGGLVLIPLVAARATGALRQALTAAAGVVAGALTMGLLGRGLPFDGASPPLGLGLAGSESPLAVAGALFSTLADHRLIAVEAAILAAVTLALPLVRRAGPLAVVGLTVVLLPLLVIGPPLLGAARPEPFPIVAGTLLLGLVLGLPFLRARTPSYTRSR
ncbi:MAG: serine/threonine-protein kinase [Gaiellales bacterium]